MALSKLTSSDVGEGARAKINAGLTATDVATDTALAARGELRLVQTSVSAVQSATEAARRVADGRVTPAQLAEAIEARQALLDRRRFEFAAQPDNRPGDGPGRFALVTPGGALGGTGEGLPDLPFAAIGRGSNGAVARVGGGAIVVARRVCALEPGRVYRARFVYQRRADTSDPANHAVVCGIAFLGQTGAVVPNGLVAVRTDTVIRVASGRREFTTTLGRNAGGQAVVAAPAGAVYARCYVQTFGDDGLTDIEVMDCLDATGLTLVPDLAAGVAARVAALEGSDAAARLAAIESQLQNPNSLTFAARSDAASATIPASITTVQTRGRIGAGDGGEGLYSRVASVPAGADGFISRDGASWLRVTATASLASASAGALSALPALILSFTTRGFAAEGDRGGAEYRRVAAQPGHAGRIRTLDRFLPGGAVDPDNGGWWEISSEDLNIRMFGAKGDGLNDDASAIQLAYLATTALGRRSLSGVPGTYRMGSTVTMTEGVVLSGGRDAVFRAADNGPTVLFEAGSASRVGLVGITIDGNRSKNPVNGQCLVHLRGGEGSFVLDCALIEAPYIAVAGAGDNQTVSSNEFHNCRENAIFHIGTVGRFAKNFIARLNRITGSMAHAINIAFEDGYDVSMNYIRGQLLGARATMRVNVSGTTVTFASGPENFAKVKPGEFLVMNRGQEWHIGAKIDDNTIVVEPNSVGNPPQGGNQTAMVGSGDLVGLNGVRNGKLQANTISYAVTFGGGVITSGANCDSNLMSDNYVLMTGKHGLIVSCEATNAIISRTKVLDNVFEEAGCGSDAVSDFERTSLAMYGGPGFVTGTFVDGNKATSDTSIYGPVLNWLGFDLNMKPATVVIGKANSSTVFYGRRIVDDVKRITLGPEWGARAVADQIVSTGDRVSFRIVAVDYGRLGYPTATVSKVTDVGSDPTIQAILLSSAGGNDMRFPFVTDGSLFGSWKLLWTNGTPVTSDTILGLALVAH